MEELVRIQNDWDTNVNIVNVRIYKPKLPEALEQAYAHQAEEKAQKKVELEKYSRIQQQNNNLAEETRGRLEREAAEYAAIVAKDLASQEGELKQKAITNEILVAQAVSQAVIVKTQAEAKYFADQKQAEANKLLFTPQYIQLQKASAISSNAKIIAGDLGKAILTFQDIPVPCSGEGCEIAFGSN
jgi:isoleucyl-tRNA synthetase